MKIKIDKNINNLDDWLNNYPPVDSEKQWKCGRSAKETAKEYIHNKGISMIQFLNKNGIDSDLTLEGEKEIKFDDYKGKGRVQDIILFNDNIFVSVEAKADESFGEYYSKEILDAKIKKVKTPNSKKLDRCKNLIEMLDRKKEIDNSKIRYQLLTALAGALKEGNNGGFNEVYLVIQVFKTNKTEDNKIRDNKDDLIYFLYCLPGNIKLNKNGMSNDILIENSSYNPYNKKIKIGYVEVEVPHIYE